MRFVQVLPPDFSPGVEVISFGGDEYDCIVTLGSPALHSRYPQLQFSNLNQPAIIVIFAVRLYSRTAALHHHLITFPNWKLRCQFYFDRPPRVLQGPFCEIKPKTCLGDVPPLFDYLDGINPCLCVDAVTVFDRDSAFGLFRAAMGVSCVLLLQCITMPCLSAISADIARKISKVVMPCPVAFKMFFVAWLHCFLAVCCLPDYRV
jgi:hypothetical protein